jgi:hypothetical protein
VWDEGRASIDIAGAAGEVVFVGAIGSVWSWDSSHRLERGDPTQSRARAALTHLEGASHFGKVVIRIS